MLRKWRTGAPRANATSRASDAGVIQMGVLDQWLGRERIVAGPGFNRWLIPPAALAIHLCIGMAYGFSVFWLPLSRALGAGAAQVCAVDTSVWTYLTTTS